MLSAQKLHTFRPNVAKIVQNQTKIKVAETEKGIKKDNTLLIYVADLQCVIVE